MMSIMKNHQVLTSKATVADSWGARLKGLLGKPSLSQNEALILDPCTCVHTFFMKFSIDVVFTNSRGEIVSLYSDLKPFRLTWLHWSAKTAIELSSGTIEKWHLKIGQVLTFNGDPHV